MAGFKESREHRSRPNIKVASLIDTSTLLRTLQVRHPSRLLLNSCRNTARAVLR
jgi:hypothetical protein